MKRQPSCYYVQPSQWRALLLLGLMLLGLAPAPIAVQAQQLALLIAAPWENETAMHNDLVATYDALRQRGFAPEEFLILEGSLTRSLLLAFLQDVHKRIALWPSGHVWLSFSGHGTFRGTTTADAQAGLLLTRTLHPSHEDLVWWEEVFAALDVPVAVQLMLLPDA